MSHLLFKKLVVGIKLQSLFPVFESLLGLVVHEKNISEV